MSSFITSLIKFTNYPDSLMTGKLYCNTWEYFQRTTKNGIGDPNEMTQSVLKTEYENRMLNTKYSIRLASEDQKYLPIYCMYAYYSKKFTQARISRLSKSIATNIGNYNYAVVITNVKEFLTRINHHLPNFCYSPIEYMNYDLLRGKTLYNPITKKDKRIFGYQKEFRFYDPSIAITRINDFFVPGITKIPGIENNGDLAEIFTTEDMYDIAIAYTAKELTKEISVDLQVDWDYCHKSNLVKFPNSFENEIYL